MIARHPDWEQRLAAHLDAHVTATFAWGGRDCSTFMFAGIEAMSSENLRGAWGYTTGNGALRALHRRQGAGAAEKIFAATISELLADLQEVGPLYARRGDPLLVRARAAPFDCACALLDLSGRWAVTLAPSGLARLPLSAITHAWRLPFPGKA